MTSSRFMVAAVTIALFCFFNLSVHGGERHSLLISVCVQTAFLAIIIIVKSSLDSGKSI